MLKFKKSCGLPALVILLASFVPRVSWSLPTVGATPKMDSPKTDIRNPLNWVGKKFILLEQPKSLQHFDYQGLHIHQKDYVDPSERNPDLESDSGNLLYSKFAGDILTVTNVKAESDPTYGLPQEYDIIFNDDNKSIAIYTSTTLGNVDDIAPVEELDMVKKTWLGKYIWSKSRILWQYDPEKGEATYITIPLGERLKVSKVEWGSENYFPVWVIVTRNDGETGYYEIAGTPINKDADLYDIRGYWRNNFYDHNPKKDYSWPQPIWDKVCHGEVSLGMTYDQVELALDSPDHINRDVYRSGATTQWVYKHRYVYFTNRKVTAIQDR